MTGYFKEYIKYYSSQSKLFISEEGRKSTTFETYNVYTADG